MKQPPPKKSTYRVRTSLKAGLISEYSMPQ